VCGIGAVLGFAGYFIASYGLLTALTLRSWNKSGLSISSSSWRGKTVKNSNYSKVDVLHIIWFRKVRSFTFLIFPSQEFSFLALATL